MAHKHRSLSIDAPLEAALSSAGYSIRLLGSHIIYADETDARRASDLGGGDVTRGAPGARGERMVTGRGLGGVDLDELRRSGAGAGVPGEVVSLLHLRRRIRGIQAAVGTADRYLAHCSDWSFY